MRLDALIQAQFDEDWGSFVLVEDAAVVQSLVTTGSLDRSLVPAASATGLIVVGVESEASDFLFEWATEGSLEAFMHNAYLTLAEPERLVLADPRPLYDLLMDALPTMRDRVPAMALDKFLKQRRYATWFFGYYGGRTSLTDPAFRSLQTGASFSGMFSVCPHCKDAGCFSTYAWVEQRTCLLMVVRASSMSLELFPFRTKG